MTLRISSLPTHMAQNRTIFALDDRPAKLPMGPTSLKPGPMLPRHASEVVKAVTGSEPSHTSNSNRVSHIGLQ